MEDRFDIGLGVSLGAQQVRNLLHVDVGLEVARGLLDSVSAVEIGADIGIVADGTQVQQVLDLRDVAELRGLRSEELRFDSVAQRVTRQTKHGEIVGRWYAELLATYYLRDSIFRWAWAGTSSSYSTYGERIFKEGQQREVPQLCMSVVGGVTPEDADVLTQLGLALTGGDAKEPR